MVLAAQPDMELVAEATNGQEAVDLARKSEPDVIIMDLKMPVKDGVTAAADRRHLLFAHIDVDGAPKGPVAEALVLVE